MITIRIETDDADPAPAQVLASALARMAAACGHNVTTHGVKKSDQSPWLQSMPPQDVKIGISKAK